MEGLPQAVARSRRFPFLWRNRGLLLLVAFLVASVVVLAFIRTRSRPEPPRTEDPFPLTPLATSPYLNTGLDARYIGSAKCRECHEHRHESFRHTGMGRSMAAVDPSREPADTRFEHPSSRRAYEVERLDGQIRHRELLLPSGPEKIVLTELPMTYVVGSGSHSLTYVADMDGYLVESPLTWYSRANKWGMSPGYDSPRQPGFQRAVGGECLFCHAGRFEVLDGSYNRVHIVEAAIGCERCHGPGSLHVARHAREPAVTVEAEHAADMTIVNPARLSRNLAESICQQCHLRPTSLVTARGRSQTDFRPGLPLEDYVQAYLLEAPDAVMTVVGHVEQMHESACYKASGRLTCLTCHSPHSEPSPAQAVAHYTQACLRCHGKEACKVDAHSATRSAPGTIACSATCRVRRPKSLTWPSRITGSAFTRRDRLVLRHRAGPSFGRSSTHRA